MAAASSTVGDVATKLEALSIGDTAAATAAVVGGEGTINDDMPFVNRHEELWQVFCVNAKNINKVIDSPMIIENYRPLELLFCVQYYGAGKTTLGRMFPSKITEDAVKQFIAGKLESESSLVSEWQHLQQHRIHRVLIDVSSETDIIRKAARAACGNKQLLVESPEHAAQFLVSYAVENGPTLFHFDEVGSKPQHNLQELRELARAVWSQMWDIKHNDGADAMPRIYFLVTGKSTEPFHDVGIGHHLSPCGSRFLVLDMLSSEHIGEVRRHVMALENHPLQLHGLTSENEARLDQCLADATGGAPRLLLYALRALHYLQPSLDSPDAIDKAINSQVLQLLLRISTVAHEFYPGSDDTIELACFRLLLAFHIQRRRLTYDTRVKVGVKKEMSVGRMLRFQPFFLSRDGTSTSDFILHLPLYHLKAAASKFGSEAVPMLLIAMAGATVRANEPWRIFEVLPAHIVATQAALSHAKSENQTACTWAEALPMLFGDSHIAQQAAFDIGSDPFQLHFEGSKSITCLIENDTERFAKLSGAILPPDKSESADLFHVQRSKDGKGHIIIEWQQKFFTKKQLTMSIVSEEVKKANSTLPTVLVMFAAQVGPQLLKAVENDKRVLVLSSWSDTKTAEFVMSISNVVLWRSSQSSKWFHHPSQETVFQGNVKADAVIVSVRPQLEVVIPHHDVIRDLVGAERFDSLMNVAKENASVESTTAVITSLDDVLSGQPSQQEKKEDSGIVDPFANYTDNTEMQVVIRAIAAERNYSEEDIAPALNGLRVQLIKTVGDLRVLTVDDIKELQLPPVVRRYLLRVKQ